MPGKPLLYGEKSPIEKQKLQRDAYLAPDMIPGYSEVIQARDIAKSVHMFDGNIHTGLTESEKREYYIRLGTEPRDLPWEFQWVRVCDAGGRNSPEADRAWMFAEYEGWEIITVKNKTEFEELYSTDNFKVRFPPGAHLKGDGRICRLDVALAVIDGELWRKLEEARQREREAKLQEEKGAQAWSNPGTGVAYESQFEESGTVTVKHSPNL